MRFYKLATGFMLAIAAIATTQSAAFSAQAFNNPTHPTLEEVAAQTSNTTPNSVQMVSCASRFDDSSLTSEEVAAIQSPRACDVNMQAAIPSTQVQN